MHSTDAAENIAILRTDRIGEVLLSTVAVDAAKRTWPSKGIVFVTSEYSRPLIDGRGDIEEVMVAETMGGRRLWRPAMDLAAKMRRKRCRMALVMNPHKMLHLACFLARIPVRIGYDRKWGCLLTRSLHDDRDRGEKHEIEYAVDLMRAAGMVCEAPYPGLYPIKGYDDRVTAIMNGKGMDPSKLLVAVHPGSSDPEKIWSADGYSEVIANISEYGCNVAVFGSVEEKGLCREITGNAGKDVFDMSGELDLAELTAFLERCSLFLGNDTGPMHMAAALGVPVVAIFLERNHVQGAGPVRWGPWGKGHIVIHETRTGELYAPYMRKRCDYRPEEQIGPEKVWGAVKDKLQRMQ